MLDCSSLRRDADTSLVATVRDAAEALWHQRFGRDLLKQIYELRKDPEAWEAYLAEAEETQVTDGIVGDIRMGDQDWL